MEHKPLLELQAIADVELAETQNSMTPEQRRDRWITVLQGHGERKLRSLHEIEHLPAATRRTFRADDSPLAVAYQDPILRSAGLRSDRVGDCTDFFAFSDRQMHYAFCSCHVGAQLTGTEAAERLQQVARGMSGKMTFSLWRLVKSIFRTP
jgi:hypothetical protein